MIIHGATRSAFILLSPLRHILYVPTSRHRSAVATASALLSQSTMQALWRLPKRVVTSASNRFLAVSPQNLTFTSTQRWYRGDSSDMKTRTETLGQNDAISEREALLLKVAQPRYNEIYERHIQLPKIDDINPEALYGDSQPTGNKEHEELKIRRKRLIYRSKQRGWLEVDLLLGTWANKCVPAMSVEELNEFERFVNLETVGECRQKD